MSIGVIYILSAIIFLGVIAFLKLQSTSKKSQDSVQPVRGDDLAIWPFTTMPIMTDTEVIFFHKLENAFPEYHIFVQVQLSRIIEANSEETSERGFWFNRICRQSVDYVLVDIDAQTTLVAIELDDWTHSSQSRQKADDKKDKALASAGIAIVRFHAERMPSVDMLRYEVMQVLESY